jgi:surface polysaccharide O-acyltransferase-like enzyme
MKKNNYSDSLDVAKAIAAYLVVFIHCGFPGTFGKAINIIARVAVPLFFIIAGFYSYPYNKDRCRKKIVNDIKLCILMELLYSVVLIKSQPINSILVAYLDINSIKSLLLFSGYGHFGAGWFLYALLFCDILGLILSKVNDVIKRTLYILAPLLLIMHLIWQYVWGPKISSDIYTSNFFLMGMPFYIGGGYMHEKVDILKMKKGTISIITIIGICLSLTEGLKFGLKDLYLGSIIAVFAIFSYCITNKETKRKALAFVGKHYSKYIYCFHLLIKEVFITFESTYSNYEFINTNIYSWSKPLIICVITTLVACIYGYAMHDIKLIKYNTCK